MRSLPTPGSFAGLLLIAALLGACGTSAPSGTPTPLPTPSPTAAPSLAEAPSPSTGAGFAFDAESVLGYYASKGYTCGQPAPSAQAAGFLFTTCQFVDPAGRTLVIGVVTDPNDELADGFASVRGTASEPVLDPTAALQPLAGFLGAMLGPTRGEELLAWLAGHIGDSYAETTSGALKVATYIKGDDHSTIYVELANDTYLAAPPPSGSSPVSSSP